MITGEAIRAVWAYRQLGTNAVGVRLEPQRRRLKKQKPISVNSKFSSPALGAGRLQLPGVREKFDDRT